MSGYEVRVERMTPAEIDSAIARRPRAFLPLGALEAHGGHLPIGTDGLNAHGLCVEAARRSGGIVLPVFWQAVGGEHARYRWTIMMDEVDGIRRHLFATLARLEELGVARAVLVSGHFAGEQTALVDTVAEEWSPRSSGRLQVFATALSRCSEAPLPPDHAGPFESGILSELEPELVRLDRLPGYTSADDGDQGDWGPQRHDPTHPLWGVFGPDPRSRTDPTLVPVLIRWLDEVGG